MGDSSLDTAIFVQVHLNSKRLPRKAVLPLAGATIIELVMRALNAVAVPLRALLTDEASADTLRPYARNEGFELFVGPADDVLLRFCQAARFYRVRRVIRATGDNPLVCPKQISALLPAHQEAGADLSHYLGPPLGTGVEVVETAALNRAQRRSSAADEHEHITTHLYRHRQVFNVQEFQCPPEWAWPDEEVSLDTEKDYHKLHRIFDDCYRGQPITTEELIRWLHSNSMDAHGS